MLTATAICVLLSCVYSEVSEPVLIWTGIWEDLKFGEMNPTLYLKDCM